MELVDNIVGKDLMTKWNEKLNTNFSKQYETKLEEPYAGNSHVRICGGLALQLQAKVEE